MNRDISVSAFNAEFAFENRNIRLATNEGNTMMSWVSERGTKKMSLKIDTTPWSSSEHIYVNEIAGTPIGTAVIDHKLVLFTAEGDGIGNIYVFETSTDSNYDYTGKLLTHDNYGFDVKHPLETLVSYESKDIQKVYWTDYNNQLRMINVADDHSDKRYSYWEDFATTAFDFKQPASLSPSKDCLTVDIEKIYGSGEFPAGVIQYAFTYFNKYGQETNIFYVSPLQYISFKDRGASPEEKVGNSFRLSITVPREEGHEYLRIYSILRTSLNATPLCKKVIDLKVDYSLNSSTITYIDTGTNGETIDPTELLYKSGSAVTCKTLEQKDNTLFLGGIKTIKSALPKEIREFFKNKDNISIDPVVSPGEDVNKVYREKIVVETLRKSFKGEVIDNKVFKYINSIGISGFKYMEYYRVGIQFQDTLGNWSEPEYITDYQIKKRPEIYFEDNTLHKVGDMAIPQINVSVPESLYKMLKENGYINARVLIAEPSANDRTIICQGIANPTLYQLSKRYGWDSGGEDIDYTKETGTLYAQSSWIFRPWYNSDDGIESTTADDNGGGYIPNTAVKDTRAMDFTVRGGTTDTDSDQPSTSIKPSTMEESDIVMSPGLNSIEIGGYLGKDGFNVDRNILTVHSPELVFDETIYSKNWNGFKIRVIGAATFTNTFGDISIQTNTPTIGDAAGFIEKTLKTKGNAALISGLYYEDYLADDVQDGDNVKYQYYKYMKNPVQWPVYMWHHNGSLNNDCTRDNRSAELLKKKISNYHLATEFNYYDTPVEYGSLDIKLFSSEELTLEKINGNPYMGNIDTLVAPKKNSFKYFSGDFTKISPNTKQNIKCLYRYGQCNLRLANKKDIEADRDDENANKTRGIYGITTKYRANEMSPFTPIPIQWVQGDDDIGYLVADLNETKEGIRIKYKSTPHLVIQLGDPSNGNLTNGTPFFENAGEAGLPIVEIYKDVNLDTIYGGISESALKANTWIPVSEPYKLKSLEWVDANILTTGWGDTYYQTFECLKTYAYTEEDINQVIDIASFICETHVNIDGRYDRNRGQIDNLNMSPQNFNLHNPVYSQLNNFFSYKIQDEDSYNQTEYGNTVTWSLTKESGADVDVWTNITLASTLELDGNKGTITKLVKLDNQLIAFQDSGFSQILYNEQTQITSTEGVPIEIANSGKVQGKRYYSNTVGCSNPHSIAVTPSGIYFMDSNNKSIYMFNGQLNNLSTTAGFNAWAKQNIPSAIKDWTPDSCENYAAYYDQLNQEILFINDENTLVYSEKLNFFTSFYDYAKVPYFCNLDDTGLWVSKDGIWKHQAGEYCNFFDVNYPFSMTLIGNAEPQLDKIFTNLEFRACVEGEGSYNNLTDKFIPLLPFDSLEVWNEYQHGVLNLTNRNKGDRFTHGTKDGNTWLNRKFRIWRCDMPRDNAPVDASIEAPLGIKRFKARPLDRIRNPWVYIKLTKNAARSGYLSKTEVHDIVASYFG